MPLESTYSTELALMIKQTRPKTMRKLSIMVMVRCTWVRRPLRPSLTSFSVMLFMAVPPKISWTWKQPVVSHWVWGQTVLGSSLPSCVSLWFVVQSSFLSPFRGAGQNSKNEKEFVNKSLFLVVELKRSIPRPFYSRPRTAQTVWETVWGWR